MLRAVGLTIVFAGVAALLCAAPADAGCRVSFHRNAVMVAPSYAPAVALATPFYPQTLVQAVYVPSYTATFLGSSYSELEGRLRLAIRDELQTALTLENRLLKKSLIADGGDDA